MAGLLEIVYVGANYSAEAEPLAILLRKGAKFKWGDEQENAFRTLKKLLLNSEVLAFPRFEILYGFRPMFSLSLSTHQVDFDTVHPDYHAFMKDQFEKVMAIRSEIQLNAEKSGEVMKERYNGKVNPLRLTIGDYVYLSKEPTGRGKKFQPKYAGPYIVNKLPSPHMVILREPNTFFF